jgi:DNA polymerase-3 subunit beta
MASLSGGGDGGLDVRAGAAVVRLPAGSPDRFSGLLEAVRLRLASVEAGVLGRMLDQTAFASSKDPDRFNLSGVFFEWARGELRAVATDGRRLSLAARPIGGDLPRGEGVIVPREGVAALRALAQQAVDAEGAGAKIEIGLTSTVALARRGAVTVSARPISGRFPDYASAIPPPVSPAKVERARLLHALRRVAAVEGHGAEMPLGSISAQG